LKWVAGAAERHALIEANPHSALVSEGLPLRANLSVLENIAIVPQYRQNLRYDAAADQAWGLLALLGRTAAAFKRDPDLDYEERFIAKLLRAVILTPPIILIDRPAQMLPDTHYPPFLDATLATLDGRFEQCWIVDYPWNEPLYAPR
jgi:ABC-type lipoprotein export system ATPase subunit